MSEDTVSDSKLAVSAMENYPDFPIVQQELTNNEDASLGSNTDTSLMQITAHDAGKGSEGAGGRTRLESLREHLSRQQERLTALRERVHHKPDDVSRMGSASESIDPLRLLEQKAAELKGRNTSASLTVVNAKLPNESTDTLRSFNEVGRHDVSTPMKASYSEKLLLLKQCTEKSRALVEQHRRDNANTLLTIKSRRASSHIVRDEFGSSMTDLRLTEPVTEAPVSRHRSAADLQQQQQIIEQFDEGRLKLLKSKAKVNELKQNRREQELEQELHQLRLELKTRVQRIEELETSAKGFYHTISLQNEELDSLRQLNFDVNAHSSTISAGEESTLDLTESAKLQAELSLIRQRNDELENINDMLESTRCELQDQLQQTREKLVDAETQIQDAAPSEQMSTDAQVNVELAKQLQELQRQLEAMQSENETLRSKEQAVKVEINDLSISERLNELEATIEAQRANLQASAQTINTQTEQLAEKRTELNVLSVNLAALEAKLAECSKSKPIFLPTISTEDANTGQELQQLKQRLDESNKINIKLKLKCKQTEKQLEKLKSSTDLHKQLTSLSNENDLLQQRITVLEDEKGQWQLAQEESSQDTALVGEDQANAIRVLEQQKLELQQALQALKQGNDTALVESQLSEAQLEEQLLQRVQQLEAEATSQGQKLQELQNEKETLDKKLSHYINENMELLDKLEKLSSSSSAESIEIVERPTQQEREGENDDPCSLTLPSFVSELTQTDIAPEVSESLAQLREESAELLKKIELFTAERREVLEKMEHLKTENTELQAKVQQYAQEAQQLENVKCRLEQELDDVHKEKHLLSLQVNESNTMTKQPNLTQELTSMQKSSEVVAALDSSEGSELFDKCEQSLCRLSTELHAYNQATVRSSIVKLSKKLANQAQIVHEHLTELLQKVKEASNAVETVTVVETVVAVTAPNGKALAEYEQLTAHNAELKSTIAALERELQALRDSSELSEHDPQQLAIAAPFDEDQQQKQQIEQNAEINRLQLKLTKLESSLQNKETTHGKEIEQLVNERHELEAKLETYEAKISVLQTEAETERQKLFDIFERTEQESFNTYQQRLGNAQISIDKLKTDNQSLELRNKTLSAKLKKIAANLKVRATEKSELETKLTELQKAQAETENNNRKAAAVVLEAQPPARNYELEIQNLQQQLEAEQSTVAKLNVELKQKIHTILDNRNNMRSLKEHLQKMQYDEKSKEEKHEEDIRAMHQVISNGEEEWKAKLREQEIKLKESQRKVSELQASLTQMQESQESGKDELRQQLEQKSTKFEKSKEVIKQRNAAIQTLQRELNDLRQQLQSLPKDQPNDQQQKAYEELQQQHAQLNEQYASEKAYFEQTVASLETLHDGIKAKQQQDMSYIESLETENTTLKDKAADLEEQARELSTQHATMAERVALLEHQLQDASAYHEQHETQLLQRIQALSEVEKSLSRELHELKNDADDTRDRLVDMQNNHETLLAKYNKLNSETQAERDTLANRNDVQLQELRDQLNARETDLQRQRATYDARLAVKVTELDEMECELSAHMERATTETRELTQQLERVQEQLNQKSDELTRTTEELNSLERERASLSRELNYMRLQQGNAEQDALELQELRMQALQDKTEIDNLRAQIESLCANHSQELQILQQQIAEKDALGQNQTDDQVYIQTENKRLADQLVELQLRLDHSEEQLRLLSDRTEIAATVDNAAQSTSLQMEVAAPPPAPAAVAAPAMFFNTDIAAPSPFDELVQPRLAATQLGASVAANVTPMVVGNEQPTIEDLQRNVSDLEKHAQDLESKLLTRNQTLVDYERQQLQYNMQMERQLAELQAALTDRETQYNQAMIRISELELLLSARVEPPQLAQAVDEQQRLADIDKQIQPDLGQAGPTLDMFFGAGESEIDAVNLNLESAMAQAQPVIEEVIQPKNAYLCYPEQETVQDLGMDDDPWANAAAEQQQQPPPPLSFASNERIAELELKLAAVEQQKQELQAKTVKLMKRIKEYKVKAAATTTENASGFGDLDSAIIDELKHQIELHEAKQAKTEELLQQQAHEKEKLVKRIDVLTAGNERMAEMKERQDMDVQMYQARIRELQNKLNQLDSWGDEQQQPTAAATAVTEVQAEPSADNTTPALASIDVNTLAKIDELQAENHELNAEHLQLQAQLRDQEVATRTAVQAKEALSEQLESLESQLNELRGQLAEKQQEVMTSPSFPVALPSDEHVALLQEKESEIVHLKQRIEELMREDQTEKLVLEILTKNQELQLLRIKVKQLEEDKQDYEEKEKIIETTASQNEANESAMAANRVLQTQLDELHKQNDLLEQEKNNMEEELRILNKYALSSMELEDKMKQSVLELDTKNIEIAELRKSLEMMQHTSLQQEAMPQQEQQQQQQLQQQQQQLQQQIMDYTQLNQQWEAVVEQKCAEVAQVWQAHLAQRETDFQTLETQLRAQIEQLLDTSRSVAEQLPVASEQSSSDIQDISFDISNDMLLKMQKALETQEMEIVTLKEQLAIRSAEYARLAAQYDPFRLQNTLGGGAAAATVTPPIAGGDALPEYVLKADLDHALMMVHQRDVRVEEMIVELVQLLEERDQLQLKLSDTLRRLEAERSRVSETEPSTGAAVAGGNTSSSSSSSITASSSAASSSSPSKIGSGSSSSDLSATNIASGSDLKQKLAELQTVKHSKDKAIVDEREQRLQQMIQLQKDMAKTASTSSTTATATIPTLTPTSASSTTVQEPIGVDLSQPPLRSPSMVLMDWIMGNNKSDNNSAQQN